MNAELDNVLRIWVEQAMSGTGYYSEGLTPTAWVTKNVALLFKERVASDLSDVEGIAGALRHHAEELGGWKKKELGDLMHELIHLDENLAQLRTNLGLAEATKEN